MQTVTSAVRVFFYDVPLGIFSLSFSMSFSTKDVMQNALSECRTAQPPWIFQQQHCATCWKWVHSAALPSCALAKRISTKAREEKDSLPFSREFGPSSTPQCVDGYKPVF